jgi:hypothetical protein
VAEIERIVTELARRRHGDPRPRPRACLAATVARHITPNGVYFANRTMPAFVVPEPVKA